MLPKLKLKHENHLCLAHKHGVVSDVHLDAPIRACQDSPSFLLLLQQTCQEARLGEAAPRTEPGSLVFLSSAELAEVNLNSCAGPQWPEPPLAVSKPKAPPALSRWDQLAWPSPGLWWRYLELIGVRTPMRCWRKRFHPEMLLASLTCSQAFSTSPQEAGWPQECELLTRHKSNSARIKSLFRGSSRRGQEQTALPAAKQSCWPRKHQYYINILHNSWNIKAP